MRPNKKLVLSFELLEQVLDLPEYLHIVNVRCTPNDYDRGQIIVYLIDENSPSIREQSIALNYELEDLVPISKPNIFGQWISEREEGVFVVDCRKFQRDHANGT